MCYRMGFEIKRKSIVRARALVLFFAFVTGALLFTGCASTAPRFTKFSSPTMRIMVDPESVDSANHVRIENALMKSGKYFIVTRGRGFNSVVQEQNLQHNEGFERFSDEERYGQLHKLYGVGGIVVGHISCAPKHSIFHGGAYMLCIENLALIDASTGEVVAAAEGEATDAQEFYGAVQAPPSWDGVVGALNNAVPEHFQFANYEEPLRQHRRTLAEESQREREKRARAQ